MTAAAANMTAANMSRGHCGRRTQLPTYQKQNFLICSVLVLTDFRDYFFFCGSGPCNLHVAGTALALEQPASSMPSPHQNIMTFCLSRSGCCLS
jgi:hypothetical protein